MAHVLVLHPFQDSGSHYFTFTFYLIEYQKFKYVPRQLGDPGPRTLDLLRRHDRRPAGHHARSPPVFGPVLNPCARAGCLVSGIQEGN